MTPLILWCAITLALLLRLLGAWLRPVWVDEAASAIFTAGNSSWTTPVNELVGGDRFVQALKLIPPGHLGLAMSQLHAEDNHPPLHFAIAHLTAQLLQPQGQTIDPLTARLPAVVLGSLAVPLLHRAVLTASQNQRAAALAAVLMAISPLAVAMGLEARQYALGTTLVSAALWALAASWRRLQQGTPLPAYWVIGWLLINGLGMLTHHLFGLCIGAQLLSLLVLASWGRRRLCLRWRWSWPPLLSLGLAAVWLLLSGRGGATQQTAWLDLDPQQPMQWLLIPLQLLITALTTVFAPGTTLMVGWQWPFLVLAGAGTLLGLACLGHVLQRTSRPPPLLLVFTGSSLALLLLACLASGKDFSRALRYGFVFTPGVLALLATTADAAAQKGRRRSVASLLLCSLLCCLGVSTGVSLPASYNPAILLSKIDRLSKAPIVLAFNDSPVTEGHPLIGYEGLSIAWQLQSRNKLNLIRNGVEPRLLLLINNGKGPPAGLESLEKLPGPFDLWLINAHGTTSITLERSDCHHLEYASAGGHLHHHYRCGRNSTAMP